MRMQIVAFTAAAGLVAAGCGSEEAPVSSATGNGTDRAFVASMIEHHESAVYMAEIAQSRAESDFVKALASTIARTQTEEISLMRKQDSELAETGVKLGRLSVEEHMMGMDQNPAALQEAQPFDAAFIKMMIPHHEGAIEMAREELEKGEDPELQELAQNIIDAQQAEIDEMLQHSKSAGGHSGHDG
jgi:uncharacterized protein (DUF305 family)